MSRHWRLALLSALFFIATYYVLRPTALISQGESPTPGDLAFRIVVGMNDTEAKQWKGSLTVTGGALARVQGWRFSQQDTVSPDGTFDFRTKIANLENQLRRKNLYGQTGWGDPDAQRLIPQGLIVQVRGGGESTLRLESSSGAFSFRAGDVPYHNARETLDGNAIVERLPVETRLSESGKADDYPAVAVAPDGTRWVAWLAYDNAADEVVVSGAGKLHRLTGRGDHHAPAIASAGDKRVQVVWSQNDQGTFHLYGAAWDGDRWAKPERLTSGEGSNIWPRLVSDGAGKLALVWQGFRKGQSVILGRRSDGGKWSAETQLSSGDGNSWAPAAAFGGGKLWVAWDSYQTGAYQIYVAEWGKPAQRITRGEEFSVRPSVAAMPDGRPVVAWEESDALWGKDYAFLYDRRGTSLYRNRRVRVAHLDGAEWRETFASAADSVPEGIRRFIQQPQLAADASGRLYLAFRCRTSAGTARVDGFAAQGRWETFLTTLEGEKWTRAVPMPSSVGRNGMRPAMALAGGGVELVWPTDDRAWPAVRHGDLDVFAAKLPPAAKPARLEGGRSITPPDVRAETMHPNEREDVRRVRAYRFDVGGKQYRIYRGDLHRHTELSGDGAGDGSLDDLYRYFLDAAGMDFAHVADHQMGNDEEYNWWITQKSNDLYYIPQRLAPMYGYERSVRYPNGHRNIVWAERGRRVLRTQPPEAQGKVNSGSLLYPYLRETKGIATSHTSATEQGTDWRDNDPELEPLVEIYQGFESNYEHAGAPRAWKEGESPVHQGLQPLGYIWNAWAKGYKLGVQSSSDHVSTHVSYACVLAEEFTRQALLDAMRKRHAYAATDNIVLDFRITVPEGTFLMGDVVESPAEPRLEVRAIGTAEIKQIDVIRNNAYIHKVNPAMRDAKFEYADRARPGGEAYYYVRVEQADGQLAWSSPIWLKNR